MAHSWSRSEGTALANLAHTPAGRARLSWGAGCFKARSCRVCVCVSCDTLLAWPLATLLM